MKMKKLLSGLLTLVMLLSLLPVTAFAAGETVAVASDTTSWTDGNTYVVSGEVTIESRIVIPESQANPSSVTLRLSEGSTLNAQRGIQVGEFTTLTIEGSGTLNATGGSNEAGIGGSGGWCGTVIINGGTVNATGGQYGAGIGGGNHGGLNAAIINGGTVTATGGQHGAGIGGGANGNWAGSYGHCCSVTINGGVVHAIGNGRGAGIGGGGASNNTSTVIAGNGGTVVINGGQVTATSGSGFGIGPGVRSGDAGMGANGTTSLGWTNANDFIEVSSYRGTLTFADGFYLDGTQTVATAENAGGQKLVPSGLHSVTFDPNNGSTATVQYIEENTAIANPANPVREGYSFRGWFADGAVTAWDFSNPVTQSMTLRAQWAWDNAATGAILDADGTEGYNNQNYTELLDGNLDTKWCMPFSVTNYATVSFRTASPVVPTGYLLSTGNDTQRYPGRNPNAWTLEGKLKETDEWTVLASVSNDTVLQGTNWTQYRFPLNNAAGNVYQYFRWTVTETDSATTMQMGELWLLISDIVEEISYTITWVDGDGNTLKTESVLEGATPAYTGATPTKTSTEEYDYVFTGWSPAITAVTGNATYTAQFDQVRAYTITWVDGDGNTLKTDRAAAGTTPAYTGETPTKAPADGYVYTFNNTWLPAIEAVSGDATYTAQFTAEEAPPIAVTSSTREWTNGNRYIVNGEVTIPQRVTVSGEVTLILAEGAVLNAQKGITVNEGNKLTIEGSGTLNATGASYAAGIGGGQFQTAGFIVINGGTINAAGSDYSAGIGGGENGNGGDIVINGGTVNANGGNGAAGIGGGCNYTVIGSVGHGGNIVINGGTVNATGNNCGSGIGGGGGGYNWSNREPGNGGNVTIYGGRVTATSTGSGYGIGPGRDNINGNSAPDGTITLGWTNVTDFIDVSSVRGAVTFANAFLLDGTETAATAENIGGEKLVPDTTTQGGVQYVIIWMDGNGGILETDRVAAGETPAYTGTTPTKASTAQYDFTFNGTWSPALAPAAGNVTYTAQFDATVRSYTVTWQDSFGNTLATGQALYGETPVYTGETPTKDPSAFAVYTFNGTWSPAVAAITGDTTYTAQFDCVTEVPDTISWLDDGETATSGNFTVIHDDTLEWTNGVYVANGAIRIPERVKVTGEVSLILMDGATLSATKGITVLEEDTLHIFAQSTGENMGVLNADGFEIVYNGMVSDAFTAIGGFENGNYYRSGYYENYGRYGCGTVDIAGGVVNAHSHGWASGIGAFYGNSSSNGHTVSAGDITIRGGVVNVSSETMPAMGAGGYNTDFNLTITGGVVNAESRCLVLGVESDGCTGSISITGGTVNLVRHQDYGTNEMPMLGATSGSMDLTIGGDAVVNLTIPRCGAYAIGGAGITSVTLGSEGVSGCTINVIIPSNIDHYTNTVRGGWTLPEGMTPVFAQNFFYTDDATTATWPIRDGTNTMVSFTGDYVVCFDANGGSGEMECVCLTAEENTCTLPECTFTAPAENMRFFGWQIGDDTTVRSPGYSFEVDAGVVVRAVWRTYYRVSYDLNGAAGSLGISYLPAGAILTVPGCSITPPEGMIFGGWTVAGDPNVYQELSTYAINADTVFVAKWISEYVTVTYIYDNGTSPFTFPVENGSATPIPSQPTFEGRTFLGWYLDGEASQYDFMTTVTEDITLRAVWAYDGLTATAGKAGVNDDQTYTKLFDRTDKKWCTTFNGSAYVEFEANELLVPTDYVFVTGEDSATFGGRNPKTWTLQGKRAAGDSWTTLVTVTNDMVMRNVNSTPYRFHIPEENVAESGYRYFRLTVTANGGNDCLQLKEMYLIGTESSPLPPMQIVFQPGEGTGDAQTWTVQHGEGVVLASVQYTAPEGKAFIGWLCNGELLQPTSVYYPRDNAVLVAQYAAIRTLTFTPGENSTGEAFTDQYVEGIAYCMPECEFPAPEGYACDGWIDGAGNVYYEEDDYILTGDLTFTPNFVRIYTVTVLPNNGTDESYTTEWWENEPFYPPDLEDLEDLGLTIPTEDPVTGEPLYFDGWTLVMDGETIEVDDFEDFYLTGDAVLTAKWRGPNAWERLQEAVYEAHYAEGDTATITLTEDVIFGDYDGGCLVFGIEHEDQTVTTFILDLNGYVIDVSGGNYYEDVIDVYGGVALIIRDSSESGGGAIRGGEYGVYVYGEGGSLTLEGGEISGFEENGVYIDGGCSFTMTGGTISGNEDYGVYLCYADFTMEGGEISGNEGHGVYLSENSRFLMTGGEISGNESNGVCMEEESRFLMKEGAVSENMGVGVYIKSGSMFVMEGGEISDNWESGVYNCGSFVLVDGEISGNGFGSDPEGWPHSMPMKGSSCNVENYGAEYGGGVYVSSEENEYGPVIKSAGGPALLSQEGELDGPVLLEEDEGDGFDDFDSWEYRSGFLMLGGEISGNAANCGGGVAVDEAFFEMIDGVISGNQAMQAGGVSGSDESFGMFGGSVTGNTALGMGGGVLAQYMILGGSAVISGNLAPDFRSAPNGPGVIEVESVGEMELRTYEAPVTSAVPEMVPSNLVTAEAWVEDPLTETAYIGISALGATMSGFEFGPEEFWTFAYGLESEEEVGAFFSDLDDYAVVTVTDSDVWTDGDGVEQEEIYYMAALAATFHTVTLTPGEGDGEEVTESVISGSYYTLPHPGEDLGYTAEDEDGNALCFNGWQVTIGEDEPILVGPDEAFQVSDDAVATALWRGPDAWDRLQEAVYEAHYGEGDTATITLTEDVIFNFSDYGCLVFGIEDEDQTVTTFILDLNGHVIDVSGGGYYEDVIDVYDGVALIIRDSSAAGGGAIRGGEYGVYVDDEGGSLTLEGGEISGFECDGVYIDYDCSFTMTGGEISGNGDNGVYLYYAEFTMTGGEISGNGQNGVYVDNSSRFIMEDGEISDNGEHGVADYGSFVMLDGVISGNGMRATETTLRGSSEPEYTWVEYGGGVYVYNEDYYEGPDIVLGSVGTPALLSEGGGLDSPVLFEEDEDVIIDDWGYVPGFVMLGGEISGNAAYCGGGIAVKYGVFTVTGGVITGNQAMEAGGIAMQEAEAALFDCTVTNNTAYEFGGGVVGMNMALGGSVVIEGNLAPEFIPDMIVRGNSETELEPELPELLPSDLLTMSVYIAEPLTAAARIGISALGAMMSDEAIESGEPWIFAYGLGSAEEVNAFFSDTDGYAVVPIEALEVWTDDEGVEHEETYYVAALAVATPVIFMDGEEELFTIWVGERMTPTAPENPEKAGYAFLGWVEELPEEGEEPEFYTFDEVLDDALILYAVWEQTAEPIVIVSQPVDYVGPEGSTATFTVVAEGEGLTYQWYIKNPGASEFSLSTKTEAVYTTPLRTTSSGRELYCVITDANGNTVTTNTVTMTIGIPVEDIVIVRQPVDAVVAADGDYATFTVIATGADLTYQWYIKNPGASEFSLSTKTEAVYTTPVRAATSGRELYCVITDAHGNTVTTNTVTMRIGVPAEPIVITRQPVDVVVAADGDYATFTVAATGEGLTYQWYIKNPGASEFSLSTKTEAVYTTPVRAATSGRELYCVITDANGNTVTTNTVTMTIGAPAEPIVITSQPVDAVVAADGDYATFTVVAEGEGLTYQWYIKNPGASEFSLSTKTEAVYTTPVRAATSGRELYCVITDANGNTVTTNTVTMTIGAPAPAIVITSQPVDVVVAADGDYATFTVVAEGEGLTYQWYIKNPGASEFSLSTKTEAVYTTPVRAATSGRELYCVITDAHGNTVTTNTVTMTIEVPAEDIVIVRQPVDAVVAADGDYATFTVIATGEGLTYQWYIRNPGASEFSLSTKTESVYTTPVRAATSGRELYCVITDAHGNTATTNTVTMTIEAPAPAIVITSQPVDAVVAADGDYATFTVVAEGEGLSYQWYIKNPGASEFSLSTKTEAVYTTPVRAATSGRELYCVITDAHGNTVTTNTVTMTIEVPAEDIVIVRQPVDAVVAADGDYATFTVIATGADLTYQWYIKNPGASEFSLSTKTEAVYTTPVRAATSGRELYCVITDAHGNTVTTNTVTMTIG